MMLLRVMRERRPIVQSELPSGAMRKMRTEPGLPHKADGEGRCAPENRKRVALAETIAELKVLQSQRRFCIKSQSRCDRSVESFVARQMGYAADADPKERKAVFAKASTFRKSVEKSGEGQIECEHQAEGALSAAVPLILLSAASRDGWDKQRKHVEKRMRQLARALPVWPFVESVKGFGDLGLAIILGETGNLSLYATKERVWKRLGLAVIEGERQQCTTDKLKAAAHGYDPSRRAEIWTIADSMFRHQWAGEKDGAPAHATGRYGEIYAARKAHTADREGWTLAHRDDDARRIMSKALIEDLWREWRRLGPA